VLLGAITGAHGLKGEVVLKVFTEDPRGITAYGPLQSEDGAVTVTIESLRPLKGGFAARLKGVASRNAAEALKGVGLHAPREALGQADDEDEFFHADLIGLAVEDESGAVIGRVAGVQDFGAGDLLEIALEGRRRTVLLPFSREAVPVVDLAGARIVAKPPEGLWDEAARDDPERQNEGEPEG
jgi:16S rRNA processing protein RimM